jgi:hypothetical protein
MQGRIQDGGRGKETSKKNDCLVGRPEDKVQWLD